MNIFSQSLFSIPLTFTILIKKLDFFFCHFPLLLFLTVSFFGCLVDALLIIGLPEGPTAHFKLSKLVLRKDIKVCC